jgi:DNA-directed RNA polymerase I, II, and III subunit RPABC2
MSLSDEEKLDMTKKEEGSDSEEDSVAGSETGSEKNDAGGDDDAVDAEAVAGAVDDDEAEASDIDESEGEGEEGEGEGEEPSFASGVKKLASASNKLLSNIQDVVSNAGKNVGAITGSGDDLLSKLTKSSVKMPSGRGRKKRNFTANMASSLEEQQPDIGQDDGDENDNDEDDINTKLKKFDKELRDNYLLNFHPESLVQNYDEIYNLARVVRDDNCIIVDTLHRTLPMLTKYEKSRILGQRAKQINDGATPFVKVPEGVIDGYLIAIKELEEKKIPFIIRRPLPNGGSEYWHLEDLEIIN